MIGHDNEDIEWLWCDKVGLVVSVFANKMFF